MEPITNVLAIVGTVVAGLIARVALLALASMILGLPVLLGVWIHRALVGARERALGVAHVDGLVWSRDAYHAPGHTWLRRLAPEKLRLGLDDLAQRILIGASGVKLPRPGDPVREGGVAAIVRCGDRRGAIRSPIDGVVIAVNRAVERNPSLIHRDPYGRGWLFTVKPSSARYTGLLRGDDALAWLSEEKEQLARFLEGAAGIAAADGGVLVGATGADLVGQPPSLLTDEQWTDLTERFLLTADRIHA